MSEPCLICHGDRLALALPVAGEIGGQGLAPSTDRFGTALADIHRCQNCGHMQLSPLPDEASLAEAYRDASSGDYLSEAQGQRRTAAALLAEIERERPPGTLLDLGCWVGFLPAVAAERGWKATGVEPSAWAAEQARARPGVTVVEADLDAAVLEAGSFDAVVMADVIEHLLDPAAALSRVHELMRPDAALALTLPDAGSRVARAMGRRWWSVIPTHVHYFDRDGISALLAANGFDRIRIRTAPKAFSAAYYLGRIGGYSPALGGFLRAAAGRLGFAERIWTPDFGDRMLVIARRAETG